ncbi:hypothetical protein [Pedobacter sp.]|uniref:hypothetical protein n=1 Tax=Pedobacter sp. TaxID=1411316 RepID=UPI003D7F3675
MSKNLFLLLILVLPIGVFAQDRLTGTVYDYDKKDFPLQQVAVKNLNNNQIAVTDESGDFVIPAKRGDLITFTLVGYHVDTLYLIDLKPKRIYLPVRSNSLQEVEIVSTRVSPYLDFTIPGAKPSRRVYTDGLEGKSNTDRAGGLVFALGYGKYRRQQEKLQRLEAMDEFENEINLNFNAVTIRELVKLNDEELVEFMAIYRPTIAQVSSERPFNYSYYIAQSYQAWLKLPPEQRKLPPMQRLKRD